MEGLPPPPDQLRHLLLLSNNVLGINFYIGNVLVRITGEMQMFRAFQRIKSFFSPYLLATSIRISVDTFLLKKDTSFAVGFFLSTEAWWARIAKNWILVWLFMLIKLKFHENNCRDFFPSKSQSANLFLNKMIENPCHLFRSLLWKFERPKLPKVVCICDASPR